MRCKIDEHLPLEIKDLLVQYQHDSLTVAEQGMAGSIDPDVAQVCRKEGRALLTLDLDFSDIRAYPPGRLSWHCCFSPRHTEYYHTRAADHSAAHFVEREPLIGHLWIVEDHQVRIREGSRGQTRVP